MVAPANRKNLRHDLNDVIYKTEKAKFKAVVEAVAEEHAKGRPVLVGTIAIEKSETLSKMLTRAGVPHNVLNAKNHAREADIIAQAGRAGAVTVSTNMAGRGTDILLGGNPEFMVRAKGFHPDEQPEEYRKALEEMKQKCQEEGQRVRDCGGLLVIGTERHESRRIDNQLRGRAGRQGDPGQSRFFISLEDDLMRIFGSERIQNVMTRLGMEEDEQIEHSWISRAIESAQKRVEAQNFEMRKNVLEYDDVMNEQRRTIYTKRRQILAGIGLDDELTDMMDHNVSAIVDAEGPTRDGKFDREAFARLFAEQFGFAPELNDRYHDADELGLDVYAQAQKFLESKKERYGATIMLQAIRYFMLQTVDELWKDHLLTMDHLRDGIGLRGYGQKDPKQEYAKEGFALFQSMMRRIQIQSTERIFKVQVRKEEDVAINEDEKAATTESQGQLPKKSSAQAPRKIVVRVGRNDLCPCQSGKKFKQCHGQKFFANEPDEEGTDELSAQAK